MPSLKCKMGFAVLCLFAGPCSAPSLFVAVWQRNPRRSSYDWTRSLSACAAAATMFLSPCCLSAMTRSRSQSSMVSFVRRLGADRTRGCGFCRACSQKHKQFAYCRDGDLMHVVISALHALCMDLAIVTSTFITQCILSIA